MLPQLLHQAHGLHLGSIARALLHASAIGLYGAGASMTSR